ncbi:hemerythrin domain-containing protein [Candidatus Poribacteria bacterium]|nr:hemerythrin domain-containing protein [Candidatus Poribacteria bacterium]
MRRDERLHPLSWGHHHGFVFARRLSRAADAPIDAHLQALVTEFWRDDLNPHFTAEERWLVPALEAHGELPLRARLLEEHAALRSAYGRIVQASDAGIGTRELAGFAEALTRHIRFEERELFPAIEALLDGAELDRIGTALAQALPKRDAPIPSLQALFSQ